MQETTRLHLGIRGLLTGDWSDKSASGFAREISQQIAKDSQRSNN